MYQTEAAFAEYEEALRRDEELTPEEAAVILHDLRANREFHLHRTSEYLEGEEELSDDDPEYSLHVLSSPIVIEAGNDANGMIRWARSLGITVHLHLYPPSWAGRLAN